jgi:hypothetical protein
MEHRNIGNFLLSARGDGDVVIIFLLENKKKII